MKIILMPMHTLWSILVLPSFELYRKHSPILACISSFFQCGFKFQEHFD